MVVGVFGLLRKISMKIIRITPGLGNQMFQYAFLLNYKLKGEDIIFDTTPCTHSKRHTGFDLERIFNIREKTLSVFEKIRFNGPYFYFKEREITFLKLINKIIEKTLGQHFIINSRKYIFEKESGYEFNFNQKYLDLVGDKYISGYFCSPRYFENIKEEVKKVFTFPEIKQEDKNNFEILKDIKNSESISIHVRRGDYLGGALEISSSADYFKRALELVVEKLETERKVKKEDIRIFVFSDDISWCVENLIFLKNYQSKFIDFNKKLDSYKDMQLMSECKHNIIPNSTFSWWSAYLNHNSDKIVVAPKYWFKGVLNSEDRCEKDWFLV